MFERVKTGIFGEKKLWHRGLPLTQYILFIFVSIVQWARNLKAFKS